MYSKDLASAAKEISEHFDGLKRVEFQLLTEKARLYPDGFEFYYPSTSGEPERSYILGAYLDGFASDNIQVWYRCYVPSWTPEPHGCMPLPETVIDRVIAKFGTPS